MIEILIDSTSSKPIYHQLMDIIEHGIYTGKLKEGEMLPSMKAISEETGISKETVKRAYVTLREHGLLESSQGKGFFVRRKQEGEKKKILLLFDQLSSYKLVLYRSFVDAVDISSEMTIHLHNQDIDLFVRQVDEALDRYDYYVITPHFPLDAPTQKVLMKTVSRIPNRKLILLDKSLPALHGHFGSVHQAFAQDAFLGLKEGIDRISKYTRKNIIAAGNSLYHESILKSIGELFAGEGLEYEVHSGFRPEMMVPGSLFIVIGGQLDTDLFNILRTAAGRNLVLGRDVGVVSYNDTPENEFICGGLSCLSTDFVQMGRLAAEMINTGKMRKIRNRFSLKVRNTL